MIGDRINRLDGRVKVTGAARYAAEWPIERVAHGVIVQSTIARGTITSIDTAAATAAPGVLAVLTPQNAPRLPQGGRAGVMPPLGLPETRRVNGAASALGVGGHTATV